MESKFILKSVLTALLFIAFSLFSVAQTGTVKFETPPKLKKISFTRAIFRDSRGYVWIGTNEMGLIRYDGHQIITYVHDKSDDHSIGENYISSILEDRDKNIWIGTSYGLDRYDPDYNSFKHFRNSKNDKSISSNEISAILEDKEGYIWIGTSNGLNRYDKKTKTFSRFSIKQAKGDENKIAGMALDAKNRIWFTTDGNALWCFDIASKGFTTFKDKSIDLGTEHSKKIIIDKNQKIWIAALGRGLISFLPSTGVFKQYSTQGNGTGTNSKLLMGVVEEDDNTLLIATDMGGINRFDKAKESFEYIVSDERNGNGLSHSGIYCLYKDAEGLVWVGTSRAGVNCFNPKKQKFELFRHNKSNENSLSHNIVGCIDEDHNGLIWIGTDGGGISVYDKQTKSFKNYKHDPKDPNSLSGNFVRSIKEDKDHQIWVATWDDGLNCFDPKTKKFKHYMPSKSDPTSISNSVVWNICIDKQNRIWLGYLFGLDVFDTKKGVIKHFVPKKQTESMPARVLLIQQDYENIIWVCANNGLFRYDSVNNSFKAFNHFPDNSIKAFLKDRDRNLWVGTEKDGLCLCKPDGTIDKVFNTKNGFISNQILAILQDNQGDIWISTNNGIAKYMTKKQIFRTYQESDGLQGNDFFEQSFLKSRDGQIYFGGTNGFNAFYPEKLKDNDFIPPVYITDFQIFNKSIVPDSVKSPLKRSISETKEITLNHKQSVFSLSFIAINYTNTDKNNYAYKLEGFDADWTYTDDTRKYATYTNLDPGEYVFRLMASNNDGVWNEKGTSLKIIVLPPWWNTWWFRLLSILFVLATTLSFYFYRVNTLKKQKIILEKKVQSRTVELEESNTELRKRQNEVLQQNEEIRQQTEELMLQRDTLDEYNKKIIKQNDNISASIRYALTIQKATLPAEEWLGSRHDSFILYRPKDIVSGDFYWFTEISNAKPDQRQPILLAVVDCTGHGVPGAFMSMISSRILSEIVNVRKITDPSEILEVLDVEVKQVLKQDVSDNNDGMDLTICLLEYEDDDCRLTFSGANNSIYCYIDHTNELFRIRGTHRNIGGRKGANLPNKFTNQQLILHPKDSIYFATDGFIDQNDERRTRFGTNRFIDCIRESIHQPMAIQKQCMEASLDNWKKEQMQRDDITVIGLRI